MAACEAWGSGRPSAFFSIYFPFVFHFRCCCCFFFICVVSFLFAWFLFYLLVFFFICAFSFLFAWFLFVCAVSFFLFAWFPFLVCVVSFLFAWFLFCLRGFFFICVVSFFVCSMSLVGHRNTIFCSVCCDILVRGQGDDGLCIQIVTKLIFVESCHRAFSVIFSFRI